MRYSISKLHEVSPEGDIPQVDASGQSGDVVQVEMQQRPISGTVVYVHVNGITILRIGGLYSNQVSFSIQSDTVKAPSNTTGKPFWITPGDMDGPDTIP